MLRSIVVFLTVLFFANLLYLFLVLSVTFYILFFFFFSSRRRHTIFDCDWSSDVCSSDLDPPLIGARAGPGPPQRVRRPQSPGGLRQRRPRWGAGPPADRRALPAAPAVQLERRRGPTGCRGARSRAGRVGPRATGDEIGRAHV